MKKMLAMFLALTMVFALAACGSSQMPTSPNLPNNSSLPSDHLTDVGDISDPSVDANALNLGYTADKPLKLRLASPQSNEKSHLNVLANAFKERIEAWSNGAIIVDIYMGTMGSDREIVDQVIAGTLDMGVNNTAIMANYNRLFDVLDIAYLIRDYNDIYDVMSSEVWNEMLNEFSSTGASLLCLQCIGFRTIATTEKAGMVHNLSELKNKTIRVTEGSVFLEDYNAWGASPISLGASEILPALQNGTIDGVDHAPVTLYTGNGQYEYVKNMALFNQAAHFNGLDINNALLTSLTEDARELIEKAAQEAAVFRTEELQKNNDTYIQKLSDEHGVLFYTPTEAEIQEMIDAVTPVYENFVSTHEFGAYAKAIHDICENN